MKKNMKERVAMVKAMEFICRQINDEEVFMPWLMGGVADGDIDYMDLDVKEFGEAEYYAEDNERFADLMACFIRRMHRVDVEAGLYCNGVVSKSED